MSRQYLARDAQSAALFRVSHYIRGSFARTLVAHVKDIIVHTIPRRSINTGVNRGIRHANSRLQTRYLMSKSSEILLDRLDAIDRWLCSRGLLRRAQWSLVTSGRVSNLYAGRLSRRKPQYRTHMGLTPYAPSSRNIAHNVRDVMPISACSVDVYQSEDVFEHIPYEEVSIVLDDIFRVLKPLGLFRLSLRDYRSDVFSGQNVA